MPHRLCLALTLAMGLLRGALWAAPPEDEGAESFPSWRLQASPHTSDQDIAFGIYRHLEGRWDIGCQLSTRVRINHTDGTSRKTGYSEYVRGELDSSRNSRKSIDLDLDLRRWMRKGERWGWYVGPRVGFGYGVYDYTSSRDAFRGEEWTHRTEETESKDYRVGVNLVMGMEVTLLPEMSVILGFKPLRYAYSWSKDDGTTRYEQPGEDPETEVAARSGEGGDFSTNLTPEAFVVLRLR
jgi:hypothetical protein